MATDFRRPAELAVVSHIDTNLKELWEVHVARQARREHEFADLPRSTIQVVNWKYEAPTHAVRGIDETQFLCLHNGSTSRNSAAPQTWGQKVRTSQSSSVMALGLSMCLG